MTSQPKTQSYVGTVYVLPYLKDWTCCERSSLRIILLAPIRHQSASIVIVKFQTQDWLETDLAVWLGPGGRGWEFHFDKVGLWSLFPAASRITSNSEARRSFNTLTTACYCANRSSTTDRAPEFIEASGGLFWTAWSFSTPHRERSKLNFHLFNWRSHLRACGKAFVRKAQFAWNPQCLFTPPTCCKSWASTQRTQ